MLILSIFGYVIGRGGRLGSGLRVGDAPGIRDRVRAAHGVATDQVRLVNRVCMFLSNI